MADRVWTYKIEELRSIAEAAFNLWRLRYEMDREIQFTACLEEILELVNR